VIERGLLLAMLGACAQATAPNGTPTDAPATKTDAASGAPMDAPHSVPMDAPMTTATCTTAVTCATATTLPQITGDDGDGNTVATASGYQAAWYSIRVSEQDSSILGYPMSTNTTLTSPSGVMFDLFVYVDTGNDDIDCSTPTGTVTTSGATESSNIEWGEGSVANDSDDSRTVSIEIRPKSGDSCSSAATWSLQITGGLDD
jgi:hypothetical protein